MPRIRLLAAAVTAAAALLAVPAAAGAAGLAFPDGDIEREGLGDSGATVTWATPVFDSSIGSLEGAPNCTPASGSAFPTGTTEVECRAVAKVCPPRQVCSIQLVGGKFTVTVTTGAGPELTGLVDRSAATEPGRDSAVVEYPLPTAADPSGVAPGSVVCAPASGSAFPLGDTTVACAARDTVGNESSGSFRVSVTRTAATPGAPAAPGAPTAPGGPAAPGGPPADAPRSALAVNLRRLRVSRRVARLVVVCPAASAVACQGTLRLQTRARGRNVRVGRKRFALAPGQRKTVRMRLSRGARRALAGRRRLRVKAIATTRDEAGRRLTRARTFRVKALRR